MASPVITSQLMKAQERSPTITKTDSVVYGKIDYRLSASSYWDLQNVYVYQDKHFTIKDAYADGKVITTGNLIGFLTNEEVRKCSGSMKSRMSSSNRIDLVTNKGNIGLRFVNSNDYKTFLAALTKFEVPSLTANDDRCNNVAKSGGRQRKTYKKKGKKGKKTRKTKKTKRVRRRRSSKRK
jgi:hypothetical protein